jgi:spore germination cell wall hydrolase CwlJ-like protein
MARAAALAILHAACLAAAGAAAAGAAQSSSAQPSGREARCLAMVAYAEAAVDGLEGMAAVIRVVRNRVADPRFPDDACEVIAQADQFTPVARSPVLRRVAADPEGYSILQVLGARSPAARRLLAEAHRLAKAPLGHDPTGGALYFVNPAYMEPELCPWFAGLRRTAAIGGHVFMRDRRPGEPLPAGPALDCSEAGRGLLASARGG